MRTEPLFPENIYRRAEFSADRKHRMLLQRGTGNLLMFIGLNPSSAGADEEDATSRRFMAFSDSLGFDGYIAVNLASIIETDSLKLRHIAVVDRNDPTAPSWVDFAITKTSATCACWGASQHLLPGAARRMCNRIARHRDILCLGTTKMGHPKHPLYLKGDTRLRNYTATALHTYGAKQ